MANFFSWTNLFSRFAGAQTINVPISNLNINYNVNAYQYQKNFQDDAILAIPPVGGAINLVAGVISQLPLEIFTYDETNKSYVKDESHPLWDLIQDATSDDTTAPDFVYSMVQQALLRGRSVASIDRNAYGHAKIVFDDVYSYWNHDNNYTIASVRSGSLSVKRDKKGVSFLISDLTRVSEIPTAKETLRVGDARMSFGMTDIVAHFETRNGVRYRVITSLTLFEVSPVPNPAYPATTAELRDLDEANNGSFDPADLIADEVEIQDEAEYANAVSDPEDMPSDVENMPAFNLVTYAQMLKVQLDIESVLMGYNSK